MSAYQVYLSSPNLSPRETELVQQCLSEGWISSFGPWVPRFEKVVAERLGASYAVATSCGTAALQVSLRMAGVGAGDEVILPTLTFVASTNAILYNGAVPVFLDVERETWGLDPEAVEAWLEAHPDHRVKAIMPVHLYGSPASMAKLMEVAARHGIQVVEDAAESVGTTLDGRHMGTFGRMGCLSFNGNKIITTGGGGMVLTEERDLADHIRFLIMQAQEEPLEHFHREMGYNFRMNCIQAAVGLAQLERLEDSLDQ